LLGPQSTNSSKSYSLILSGYQGNSLAGTFTGSETFSAILSTGDDQAQTATLSAAWDTTISGNPSTVSAPTIKLTVPTSAISSLAAGIYFYQVIINPGTDNLEAARGRLQLRVASGSTATLPVYCSFADMTRIVPWVATLASDEDQTGFAEQRNSARVWFENILFAHDRGQADRAYFEGGWMTPVMGRSKWLVDQLAANKLMLNPDIVRANALYALGEILEDQIGSRDGTPYQALGDRYRAQAESIAKTVIAELDTNADGYGDYVIDCTLIKVRRA
jgi:hypothetical protein